MPFDTGHGAARTVHGGAAIRSGKLQRVFDASQFSDGAPERTYAYTENAHVDIQYPLPELFARSLSSRQFSAGMSTGLLKNIGRDGVNGVSLNHLTQRRKNGSIILLDLSQ